MEKKTRKRYKASVFVDCRYENEIIKDLRSCGFESVEVSSSSFQPCISFVGCLKEIKGWSGEHNRYGITYDEISIDNLKN